MAARFCGWYVRTSGILSRLSFLDGARASDLVVLETLLTAVETTEEGYPLARKKSVVMFAICLR